MDTPAPIPVPTTAPKLDREAVLRAVAHDCRWWMLKMLAQGKPMSVTELATAMKWEPDLISKHLKVMRKAGIVVGQRDAGNDGRQQLHSVPAQFVVSPTVLDFGCCLLRFD